MSKPRAELNIQISEEMYNRLNEVAQSYRMSGQDFVVAFLKHLTGEVERREELNRLFTSLGPNVDKKGRDAREHEAKELMAWALTRHNQLVQDLERSRDLMWQEPVISEDLDNVLAICKTAGKPLRSLVSLVCKR